MYNDYVANLFLNEEFDRFFGLIEASYKKIVNSRIHFRCFQVFYGGSCMTNKFYGYYESPIGLLEVVCSETSLLSAVFVNKRNPANQLNSILKETMSQLDEYFKGKRQQFHLPISFKGTHFQKLVWNELLNIPFGQTISYKDLAVSLGNEKATRAVGNANGKNIISIVVPCHRVIGSDKSLTGYAGGIDRKKWLLEHERKFCL